MAGSRRAIYFALGANFSIFIAKSVAAAVTGSGAMMAEAVHSLADTGNQLLLLLGMREARGPATKENPLGQGKAVYFWSFIVALMLFSLGGLFSLYEGVHKLQHPVQLQNPWLAVVVLVFAIFAEGTALRACIQLVNRTRGERNFWQWFRTTRQADLVVVFGEDVAAIAGLLLALAAVGLTVWTGDPMWDALGTLAVGGLLVMVAVFVGIEIKAMLLGQSVSPHTEELMVHFLVNRPEVDHVYSIITLQLGPDVMVATKARMRNVGTPKELIADINRTEAAFKQEFPQVRWSFFEPDDTD